VLTGTPFAANTSNGQHFLHDISLYIAIDVYLLLIVFIIFCEQIHVFKPSLLAYSFGYCGQAYNFYVHWSYKVDVNRNLTFLIE